MPTQGELDVEVVTLVTHPSGVQWYITDGVSVHTYPCICVPTAQSGLCCFHTACSHLLRRVGMSPSKVCSSACWHDAPFGLHTHTGADRGRICPPERATHEALLPTANLNNFIRSVRKRVRRRSISMYSRQPHQHDPHPHASPWSAVRAPRVGATSLNAMDRVHVQPGTAGGAWSLVMVVSAHRP